MVLGKRDKLYLQKLQDDYKQLLVINDQHVMDLIAARKRIGHLERLIGTLQLNAGLHVQRVKEIVEASFDAEEVEEC